MLKLLIITVILLIGGGLLFNLIKDDAGFIHISIGAIDILTSFWLAVALLLITLIIIWFIISFVSSLSMSFSKSFQWFSFNQIKKADDRLHSGLVNFIEGNWSLAKKDLLVAAKINEKRKGKTLVPYLAAARSAYELGNVDESTFLIAQAEKKSTDSYLAVAISQARIQLMNKDYDNCVETLARVKKDFPEHPVVIDLLRQVYWQLKDWSSIMEIMDNIKRYPLFPEKELIAFEEQVYVNALIDINVPKINEEAIKEVSNDTNENMNAEINAEEKESVIKEDNKEVSVESNLSSSSSSYKNKESYLIQLNNFWRNLPKHMKKNVFLVQRYTALLNEAGDYRHAEEVSRSFLKKHWDQKLIYIYGKIPFENQTKQLKIAEGWLRNHGEDSDLLLSCARICMRAELWGKAREYYEKSLAIQARSETYAELAALLEQLGENDQSVLLYKEGLEKAY